MKDLINEIKEFWGATVWTVKKDKIGCASLIMLAFWGMMGFAIFFIIKTLYELLP